MKKIMLLIILNLFFIQQTIACGVFISGEGTNVRAEQTEILISHDEKTSIEDMVVKMTYLVNKGEANEFAWLMPFPDKPEIKEYKQDIFDLLDHETIPKQNTLEKIKAVINGNKLKSSETDGLMTGISKEINIVEKKQIGIFDVVTLKATDETSLKNWASENKFHISWINTGILKTYIEKDWTFVLMKVSENENTGDIHPIHFKFKTKEAVYPIQLTRYDKTGQYNEEKTVPITIYLVGKEKMKPTNYKLNYGYGGKVSKELKRKITNFQSDVNYITKWSKTLYGKEIKEEMSFKESKKMENKNDGTVTGINVIKLAVATVFLPFIIFGKFLTFSKGLIITSFIVFANIGAVYLLKKEMKTTHIINLFFINLYVSFGAIAILLVYKNYPMYILYYSVITTLLYMLEGEKISYDYVMSSATKNNNHKALRELHQLEFNPYDLNFLSVQRKWLTKLRGSYIGVTDYELIFSNMLFANEYTLKDWINYLKYGQFSLETMWNSLLDINFLSEDIHFEVPVFICAGIQDFQTPIELQKLFFETIITPVKEFILFEKSAHLPNFEEVDKFFQECLKIKNLVINN